MCLERNGVWEEISALKSEVLDDEVEVIVGVLDARNGNVSNLKTRYCVKKTEIEEGNGDKPTLSMIWGKMTLRISFQSSGLNLRLPSLSKSKSLVRRAQSSPKRLFS